ncbi:MAG: TolC family protein, partial [Cyclobacteriaceae bacterium]|nr:TolC family protein [Cyclobacteriaceae bacterium]
MKKLLFGFLVSLVIQPIWAQDSESLDLEKAIQLGLENNYQVKIAVETIKLREGDIGVGWSAFLPVVDAIYTRNFSNEDVTQTFVSDPETPREILGAKSRS